jgi:methylenetetrahydrofolate reductase (NADPH)
MSSPASALESSAALAVDLVAAGSIEMGAHRPQDARAIAALLPAGTPVYVNHLPRHSLADSLASLAAVREAGLEPVPHVAARRIASRAELEGFLARAVAEAGVRKALVLGGDEPEARGPFGDGASLIRSGALAAAGLREIGRSPRPRTWAPTSSPSSRLRRRACSSTAPRSRAARPACRCTWACPAPLRRRRCCASRSAAA